MPSLPNQPLTGCQIQVTKLSLSRSIRFCQCAVGNVIRESIHDL